MLARPATASSAGHRLLYILRHPFHGEKAFRKVVRKCAVADPAGPDQTLGPARVAGARHAQGHGGGIRQARMCREASAMLGLFLDRWEALLGVGPQPPAAATSSRDDARPARAEPEPAFRVVRYETLVIDPGRVLNTVQQYVGVSGRHSPTRVLNLMQGEQAWWD